MDGETARPRATRDYHHFDASGPLGLDSRLERGRRTAFRCRTGPRVGRDIRRFVRVALGGIAADRVGGKKPFEALRVSRRRNDADIHIAATDKLRLRRHSDLVAGSVVADGCADSVRSVPAVIARRRGVWPANAATGMDAVVPVEIMIGGN